MSLKLVMGQIHTPLGFSGETWDYHHIGQYKIDGRVSGQFQ